MIFDKIHKTLQKRVKNWEIENFYVAILLDNKILSIKRFAQGETRCSVNPYDIANHIRMLKGNKYVTMHNHPSGRLYHSFSDMNGIDQFRERIEFPLLGSLVFTRKTYAPFGK